MRHVMIIDTLLVCHGYFFKVFKNKHIKFLKVKHKYMPLSKVFLIENNIQYLNLTILLNVVI